MGSMMTSSNGNISHITGPLCGEFAGYRWIPLTKASETELLLFSLICTWINGWVNNHEPGDLRCHRAHYEVTVMLKSHDGKVLELLYEDILQLFLFQTRTNICLKKLLNCRLPSETSVASHITFVFMAMLSISPWRNFPSVKGIVSPMSFSSQWIILGNVIFVWEQLLRTPGLPSEV